MSYSFPLFYTFPAIRGIQAEREYFVTMCPLKLVPKIFLFNEEDINNPRIRSQRVLNKSRVPEITKYLVQNSKDYVFSSITASIDGIVEFTPFSSEPEHYNIGYIKVPIESKILINDGQHRRAAIESALKIKPEMGEETISVVLFLDEGLKRSQQMFADLNRYSIRPPGSLNILYDHRDPISEISRQLTAKLDIFNGLTEMEKTSLSNRSTKLFTLSGIYRATSELLEGNENRPFTEQWEISFNYWTEVGKHIREWKDVREGRTKAYELRKDFIHAHAITLISLGRLGNDMMEYFPDDWRDELKKLRSVNWHRSNDLWEGRVIVGGRISFSRINLTLLTSALKKIIGLPLSREELEAEKHLDRS